MKNSTTIVSLGLTVIVMVLVDRWLSNPGPGVALAGQLSEVQKMAITLMVDYSKSLTTWGIALIGLFGYWIKLAIENKFHFSAMQRWLCFAGLASSVASIFFGQSFTSSIIIGLSQDVFSIKDDAVLIPATLQYILLLLGLIFATTQILDVLMAKGKSTMPDGEAAETFKDESP